MTGEELTLTVLGCGSSGGVPRASGDWGACDPAEPRNRRMRCSLLVQCEGHSYVIDTSPDFREQILMAGPPETIDGVFFTHTHADQVHGIDDIRAYVLKQRQRIEVFGLAETITELKNRFGYCFAETMGYPAILNAHELTAPVTVDGGVVFEAVPVEHGGMPGVAGFRIDRDSVSAAYIPDANGIPEPSIGRFEGLDILIIDALRRPQHPSHFSLDDAMGWIDRLKPGRAILTNMHIDLDYATLRDELPEGIEPAFDGMRITL